MRRLHLWLAVIGLCGSVCLAEPPTRRAPELKYEGDTLMLRTGFGWVNILDSRIPYTVVGHQQAGSTITSAVATATSAASAQFASVAASATNAQTAALADAVKSSALSVATTGSTFVTSTAAWPTCINVNLLHDITLATPTPVADGQRLQYFFYATNANQTVTLDTGIAVPTSSTLTSPITVTNNTVSALGLIYNARLAKWLVVSYIRGY